MGIDGEMRMKEENVKALSYFPGKPDATDLLLKFKRTRYKRRPFWLGKF